ncbi:unnamed protein product, partial [Anisakis simplex]|uniref:Cryptochrome_C domain-containing protein n=1 Tax=Anisakis simplex TaxID=6269 RepID=A0A0M3JG00_ANISI
MATTSQDDSTWNGILVDEVELARAAEHNPHARSRLHLQNNNERIRRGVDVQMRDEEPENARQPDVEDSADENSRVWNSLLVDEIDIKHALQRSASLSANDDRVNNNYRHYLNSNLNY